MWSVVNFNVQIEWVEKPRTSWTFPVHILRDMLHIQLYIPSDKKQQQHHNDFIGT